MNRERQQANIGANLSFLDDGPSITNVSAINGTSLDETTAGSPAGFPISTTSSGAVIASTVSYGADGPAASNPLLVDTCRVTPGPGNART